MQNKEITKLIFNIIRLLNGVTTIFVVILIVMLLTDQVKTWAQESEKVVNSIGKTSSVYLSFAEFKKISNSQDNCLVVISQTVYNTERYNKTLDKKVQENISNYVCGNILSEKYMVALGTEYDNYFQTLIINSQDYRFGFLK